MIEAHFAESLAISYAHEDYNGLYELVWGLNSAHPQVPSTVRLRAAQAALHSLVSRGLVAVFAADDPLHAPESVPSAVIQQVLSDPDSWLPPNERDAPHYCFATTEEGERCYFAGEFTSL
jgi:hypothetical protein